MRNIYGERWKKIPETIPASNTNGQGGQIYHPAQIYEVSDRGRVRNKITKQLLSIRNKKGYSVVTIRGRYENPINKNTWRMQISAPISLSVGRLVAATYIFGNDLKPWYVIKHIDGNCYNNSLDNLDIKY